MSKKTIGLVLSGGGYKGLAHAGALEFLEEQNIKPTSLAGTSAGSIVSCLYSYGMPPREILDFFKSVNLFNWQHFTLKKAGLIDVNAFDKYLNKVFSDKTLGELTIPVYITATDISKGTLHIFDNNTKVADAILASSAFPGIFSPYEIGDKIYSDGGIVNNFPINIMKQVTDFVIGINVTPIQEVPQDQLSSIRAVTLRAYELMTAMSNIHQSKKCDWLIEPQELINYSTFERNRQKMDKIYNIGYEAAKESYQRNQDKLQKAIL
ncbi:MULTISPECIES: patatin-like phospholipase family protein [Myroides]|uniref:Patatin n=1 Tax=Myroides albus TaxID=2562892 RepID=A0A6I3LGD3_9FLAO|nr:MULTISPECIES: patatin-like phospholipase family protein [Myroides]MTG96864.1 patatin [Myroides albus]MVX36512.1 patatin [Myroides sp. LoEW2-1]UVD78386.1 patatin-like phospholipase family protein [Myroides albus]